MARVERRNDVIEIHWENAITYGFIALAILTISGLITRYSGVAPITYVGGAIGLGCLGYAVKRAIMVRSVLSYEYTCPFCKGIVPLTAIAESDFMCEHCHHSIPIQDGEVMEIHEVRCGFCGEVNSYNDKTEFLICEYCDREIPISLPEGVQRKELPSYYKVNEDDNSLYELVLMDYGLKVEELTECLQHMLAMNRSQVKPMLEELPVTLLTGITRRKAEILQSQLLLHDGIAEARPLL